MNTRTFWKAALIAGAITAILSTIPIISLLNCLLCAWIWLGGGFAVWLYNREATPKLETGQGAVLGLAMGAVAAVLASLLGVLLGGATMSAAAAIDPSVVPDFAEGLLALGAGGLIGFLINIVLYPFFGLLGALIGTAIFKNN